MELCVWRTFSAIKFSRRKGRPTASEHGSALSELFSSRTPEKSRRRSQPPELDHIYCTDHRGRIAHVRDGGKLFSNMWEPEMPDNGLEKLGETSGEIENYNGF